MNLGIARFLSVLFHPLLMPGYLFYLILYWLPESTITFPADRRWLLLSFIWVVTFVIPGLGTYAMLRLGLIRNLLLQDRLQRRFPLFLTFICYAWLTYFFRPDGNFGELFYFVMLAITASVLLAFTISFFWKISAHAIGAGGLLGLLVFMNALLPESPLLYFIILAVLLNGAIMAARLALNEHTPAQVYAGFFTGLATSTALLLFV